MGADRKYNRQDGFTLIELSIVLVIIGLVVGGVLVGQNLIGAAAVRATISQIEKYNTAANTFREKCDYPPGDIPAGPAAQFGFAARGAYEGEGDGNGTLEGVSCNNPTSCSGGHAEGAGETPMFWVDLSAAGLIDGNFSKASSTTVPPIAVTLTTSPSLNDFFPAAKLGHGNYIYVRSGGYATGGVGTGVNFFGLSAANQISTDIYSTPGLAVSEAYAIDTKIDDGLPQSGNVQAQYENVGGIFWAPEAV